MMFVPRLLSVYWILGGPLLLPPSTLLTFAVAPWEDAPTNECATSLSGMAECGDVIDGVDVIVVGAGLAGIFAAAVLEKKGKSYVVLEADSQEGGRLRSFQSQFLNDEGNSYTLEEGANFMYGIGDGWGLNPIYGLFDEYDIDFTFLKMEDWKTYKFDGDLYKKKQVRRKRKRYLRLVKKCLDVEGEDWFDEFIEGDPASLDRSTMKILWECGKWEPTTALKEVIQHFYHELEHGRDATETGLASYPEDSTFDFDKRIFFQTDQKGSSFAVSTFVAEKLATGSIHFNSNVTCIQYPAGQSTTEEQSTNLYSWVVANRTLDDGSFCRQEYKCKHVIGTFPQNVLIHEQDTIFKPKLEINDHPIRMNTMEKVWLQFTTAWWEEEGKKPNQWLVIANEQIGGQSSVFLNYNHPNLFPGSRLLMTFVDKNQLAEMENGGEVDVEITISSLRMLPEFQEPIASRTTVTDWHNNELFRGSWEIWPLDGGTYTDFENGIQPRGSLHLAGAAHCSRYWGFTWGAIFSGIWNAEWVASRLDGVSVEIIDGEPVPIKPYTPCQDPNSIRQSKRKPEWQNTYCPCEKSCHKQPCCSDCYDFFEVPQDTSEIEAEDDEEEMII